MEYTAEYKNLHQSIRPDSQIRSPQTSLENRQFDRFCRAFFIAFQILGAGLWPELPACVAQFNPLRAYLRAYIAICALGCQATALSGGENESAIKVSKNAVQNPQGTDRTAPGFQPS
jgi:hypothetical protein